MNINFKTLINLFAAAAVLISFEKPEAAIELVTVPKKESVQLTIYNSADITMVREIRTLTFKKGLNRIQFSWAGTLIDPTSLRFRFIQNRDKLDLLDTTYPPKRKDALQWNISSEYSGPSKVEITYFTSGLTWKADYVGLTNEDEDKITIRGYVKVINNSGEDYPNAKVRLVVGTINLVERISDLAKKPVSYPKMAEEAKRKARSRFKGFVGRAEDMYNGGSSGYKKEKKIIKEGLSEYFLFTIEGKESIPNRWKKRLKSVYAENVPLNTIYRLSDRRWGGSVVKFYEFKNKKYPGKTGIGQLGDSPLPDGIYKIFTMNSNNSLTFRASVKSKYVATGDKVKLKAYKTGDIRIRRVVKDYRRININVAHNYYRKPYVKYYDEKFFYETTITNTLPRKVKVEIERKFGGKYRVMNFWRKTYRVDKYTFKFFPDMSKRSKINIKYQVLVSHGSK